MGAGRARAPLDSGRAPDRALPAAIWFGQGSERALTRSGAPRPRLRLLARALRAEARYRVSRRLSQPAKWLRDLERAQNRWGELSAAPR